MSAEGNGSARWGKNYRDAGGSFLPIAKAKLRRLSRIAIVLGVTLGGALPAGAQNSSSASPPSSGVVPTLTAPIPVQFLTAQSGQSAQSGGVPAAAGTFQTQASRENALRAETLRQQYIQNAGTVNFDRCDGNRGAPSSFEMGVLQESLQQATQLSQGIASQALPGASGGVDQPPACPQASPILSSMVSSASTTRSGSPGLGACPASEFDPRGEPRCEDFKVNDRFDVGQWRRLRDQASRAQCGHQCRAGLLRAAGDQLSCLKEEMEKLNGLSTQLQEIVGLADQSNRDYMQELDAEIASRQQAEQALMGTDGRGGLHGSFLDLLKRASETRAKYQSLGLQMSQRVREFRRKQTVFEKAVQRMTLERASNCFFDETPEGFAIGQCNQGGARTSSYLAYIRCRFEQSQVNNSSPSASVRARAQANTVDLNQLLNLYVGHGAGFRGSGQLQVSEGSNGDALAIRPQFVGLDRPAFERNLENAITQIDAAMRQPGRSGPAQTGSVGSELRALARACFEKAERQTRDQSSSEGMDIAQKRTALEREGLALISGGQGGSGGMSEGIAQMSTMLRDIMVSKTDRELDGAIQPSQCTQIDQTNNAGSTRAVAAPLENGLSCIDALQKNLGCLIDGDGCPRGTQIMGALVVPDGVPAIQCGTLRDCLSRMRSAAKNIQLERSQREGSGEFSSPRCPGGRCMGRQQFIAQANLRMRNGVRDLSQTMARQSARMASRLAELRSRLGAMTPRLSLDLAGTSRRHGGWNCSGQSLCQPPENMSQLMASSVSPALPDPEDFQRQSAGALERIRSEEEKIQQKNTDLASYLGRLNQKRSECEAQDATNQRNRSNDRFRNRLGRLRNQLQNAVNDCTSQAGITAQLGASYCNDDLASMTNSLNQLSAAINADGASPSEDVRSELGDVQRMQRQLASLCAPSGLGERNRNWCAQQSNAPSQRTENCDPGASSAPGAAGHAMDASQGSSGTEGSHLTRSAVGAGDGRNPCPTPPSNPETTAQTPEPGASPAAGAPASSASASVTPPSQEGVLRAGEQDCPESCDKGCATAGSNRENRDAAVNYMVQVANQCGVGTADINFSWLPSADGICRFQQNPRATENLRNARDRRRRELCTLEYGGGSDSTHFGSIIVPSLKATERDGSRRR